MASILRRAKNYVRKPYSFPGGDRHLYDPYTPEPVILHPPSSEGKVKKPDDVTGSIPAISKMIRTQATKATSSL